MARRVLLGLCVVVAGVVCAGTNAREREDGTVKAIYYPMFVTLDSIHGIRQWVHELYLPDSKVVCNVTWNPEIGNDGKILLLGIANSFYGSIDERRDGTLELKPKYKWTQEEVEVPQQLAKDIVALAELNRRQQEMKKTIGKSLLTELDIGAGGKRQALPMDDE